MISHKMTIAACISVLSATVLASNAHATECSSLTGNQFLAAIERGQCVVQSANMQQSSIVEDDRTARKGGSSNSGKAGGGYHY